MEAMEEGVSFSVCLVAPLVKAIVTPHFFRKSALVRLTRSIDKSVEPVLTTDNAGSASLYLLSMKVTFGISHGRNWNANVP